ncbi:MAG: hypothetical protein H0T80_13130 [Betaproteobacteria bacterium]|nr:hypothetical protein [Betaproteobacteria bacterium]
MRFAYYDRLGSDRQRIYRASDAIEVLKLPVGAIVDTPVSAIRDGLLRADRGLVQRSCQALLDVLVTGYRVPPVRVRVLARRPSSDYGELHGLYEPSEERPPARVTVWMRTVQRQQVVAFRSFLRTLVHEFAHHLDYEHFKLPETFHTEGFYKRESSLANALFAEVLPRRSGERSGDNAH